MLALVVCCSLGLAASGCGPSDIEFDESRRYPGGDTTNTLLFGTNAFIRPVSNLRDEHQAAFYTGNSFFNQAWVQSPASTTKRDGLGPFFNARACSSCHPRDGRGAPPESPDDPFLALLLRLSVPGSDENTAPTPHPVYGDQFHQSSILDVPNEGTPRVTYEEVHGAYPDGEKYTLLKPTYSFDALNYGPLGDQTMVSPRIGPQVIGMGLLDAIPEGRLRALQDPDDLDGDGISGRVNLVARSESAPKVVGRFGWKAEAGSVRDQVGAAFAGDIGITNPLHRTTACGESQNECDSSFAEDDIEIEDRLFEFVVLYSALVAVPARRGWSNPEVLHGERLFRQIGCEGCHTPSHVTGQHEYPELENQKIWPYTDLLLHDMGEGLMDGRPVFRANGREWKTPPLWGIGLFPVVNGHNRLLHDGRARGVAEAILWHGGEASDARQQFKGLSSEDRDALVLFVESL